ncbi:hypothetical protein LCGC14_1478900 [marine sediment metagenome]|uniref:Uncharacterized protein n=1 Tax=marine sediment metagenome TaxID=412755 RepID=A0A0F9MBQ9_9ZZZZ
MEHTKGKWDTLKRNPRRIVEQATGYMIGNTETIAKSTTINEANAAHICKCVNSHTALLDACKEMLSECERFDIHGTDCATQASGVCDMMDSMGCTCFIKRTKRAIVEAERKGKLWQNM